MVFGTIVSRWNEEFLNTEKEKNRSWAEQLTMERPCYIFNHKLPQVRREKFETAFVTKSLGLWSKSREEVYLYDI